MEPKFQSSFIPKGPMAASSTFPTGVRPKQKSLFGFLANIIFTLAVLGSAGVFGYGKFLEASINRKGADLEAARATLEPDTIKELTRLNDRITSTKEILAKHTVVSPLYDFLEGSTMRSVRFTSFEFDTPGNGLSLTMKGQARGYASVAAQAEAFNKSKYFKTPVFSDLSLDEKGNVLFTFNVGLDQTIVSYKKQLENGSVNLRPLPSTATTSQGTVLTGTSTGTSTPNR